jgi:hypothetical protein
VLLSLLQPPHITTAHTRLTHQAVTTQFQLITAIVSKFLMDILTILQLDITHLHPPHLFTILTWVKHLPTQLHHIMIVVPKHTPVIL